MIVKINMENDVAQDNVTQLFKNENIKQLIKDKSFNEYALKDFNELSEKLDFKNMDIIRFYDFFSAVKNIGYDINEADQNHQSSHTFWQIEYIIKDKIEADTLLHLVQAYSTDWTILLGLLLGEKIEQEVKQLSKLGANELKDDKNKNNQQMGDEMQTAYKALKLIRDILQWRVNHTQCLGRTGIKRLQKANDQRYNQAHDYTKVNNIINVADKVFENSNKESTDQLASAEMKLIHQRLVCVKNKNLVDIAINKHIEDTSFRLKKAFEVWYKQFEELNKQMSSLSDDSRIKITKNFMTLGLKKFNKNNNKNNTKNKENNKEKKEQEIKEVEQEINTKNNENKSEVKAEVKPEEAKAKENKKINTKNNKGKQTKPQKNHDQNKGKSSKYNTNKKTKTNNENNQQEKRRRKNTNNNVFARLYVPKDPKYCYNDNPSMLSVIRENKKMDKASESGKQDSNKRKEYSSLFNNFIAKNCNNGKKPISQAKGIRQIKDKFVKPPSFKTRGFGANEDYIEYLSKPKYQKPRCYDKSKSRPLLMNIDRCLYASIKSHRF